MPVHLKVDTGMHRVGVAPADVLRRWPEPIGELAELRLEGVCTHCPVADEPDNPYTADAARPLRRACSPSCGPPASSPSIVHAANSAGALAHPAARYDLVRCGIAVYGIPPAPDARRAGRPAARAALASEVSFVKRSAAGEGISYGLRHRSPRDTVVATVPIGYADGVFRVAAAAPGRRC